MIMKERVKDWLIHLLGGFSKSDVRGDFACGCYAATVFAKFKADALNGLGAHEWCDEMYRYLDSESDRLRSFVDDDVFGDIYNEYRSICPDCFENTLGTCKRDGDGKEG